jgi:hypothetical protein
MAAANPPKPLPITVAFGKDFSLQTVSVINFLFVTSL